MRADLPKLAVLVCLDKATPFAPALETWLDGVGDEPFEVAPIDDIAMIAGTGGTTGQPKGVMLSGRNLETMSALTLMSYPFEGRPVYLALAPLTHAAGVLCFPILALGGRVVIMPKADLGEFLRSDRAPPRHPYVPAADADLHAAGTSQTRRDRSLVAAMFLVWRRADRRRRGSKRRSSRSGR